ncbi:hypothetical protein FRC11_011740 [Ceratobasidium sp. 423]|nr:hypothetical protein FRC11_011740 [Ceratobasidium sp. 423]
MEVSNDETPNSGSNIKLDNRMKVLLDQDLENFNPYLLLSRFEFGSEDYCMNFKQALATEAKCCTKHKPFAWQLEVTLHSHWFRVFMILLLNVLANTQVKQFKDWNLKAMAVNATTWYKDLYKAFLDLMHLLPIVKSLELTAHGLQMVIINEVHCIIKWGVHFQPQYTNIGALKLLLTRESPFIVATAMANHLMQEVIKQLLHFGPDAFKVNLGNHQSGIGYSVHHLRNVPVAADEILDYLPLKTQIHS